MSEDDSFLRAIFAAPKDSALRLVYADWLEERGDQRAEYLRLGVRFAELPVGHEAASGVRRRMIELRAHLSAHWLALLGDYRASYCVPDFGRLEQAAKVLGRPVSYVDGKGYKREIVAATMSSLTHALAYVECRSHPRANYLDINFHLRIRDASGREAAWEIQSYNPFFGCDVGFLEWYMQDALVIYREKHKTYVCRFGLNSPATFRAIEDDWVLDGHHLGYRGCRQTIVRRLAIPELELLPSLSPDEAVEWQLVPTKAR
jgi:uncharacterized protein (TIGR02996 family)